MSYGVPVNWNYDDPRCSQARLTKKCFNLPSGASVISGGFRPLLLQVGFIEPLKLDENIDHWLQMEGYGHIKRKRISM